MRYGGVIALVIATLSAWSQECGEVVVRGPEELVAGGIWSLAAHWTALPPGQKHQYSHRRTTHHLRCFLYPRKDVQILALARPVFMTSGAC